MSPTMVRALLCVLVLAAVLVAVWFYRLDRDPGGYQDEPFGRDKAYHFGIAFVLTVGMAWIVALPVWTAFWLTVAAGLGWELVQSHPRPHAGQKPVRGFWSWLDVVADTAGAMVGVALATFLQVPRV